ncbi:hypothetical protein EXIGLDRAFT_30329 [Exidia glandulosa HHB12029]|uniref:Uncharacterized protein n=1 Tax=Exidia glandulosa HHB12029 TaxID=1314781 RepID=A0A165PB70_EXIGL|nr:hypothetical protein EXIGLDRAFT_30329 [Exidia glandulosa HHB12029]
MASKASARRSNRRNSVLSTPWIRRRPRFSRSCTAMTRNLKHRATFHQPASASPRLPPRLAIPPIPRPIHLRTLSSGTTTPVSPTRLPNLRSISFLLRPRTRRPLPPMHMWKATKIATSTSPVRTAIAQRKWRATRRWTREGSTPTHCPVWPTLHAVSLTPSANPWRTRGSGPQLPNTRARACKMDKALV